jgi:hypothetical protein
MNLSEAERQGRREQMLRLHREGRAGARFGRLGGRPRTRETDVERIAREAREAADARERERRERGMIVYRDEFGRVVAPPRRVRSPVASATSPWLVDVRPP